MKGSQLLLSRGWKTRGLVLLLLGSGLFGSSASATFAAEPTVTILYGSAWSPDDTVRDGAAEFEVLMCVARLQNNHTMAGLVSVGYRHGGFPPSAEIALERVVHMGIPVVRLAQNAPLLAHEGDVFIEAGALAPAEAKRLLAECMARYGRFPVAADPAKPTRKEYAALQTKIALFQTQFDRHNSNLVAMR